MDKLNRLNGILQFLECFVCYLWAEMMEALSLKCPTMWPMQGGFSLGWQGSHQKSRSAECNEKSGKIVKIAGNLYLHFLTKCLTKYDQKFSFPQIMVPSGTNTFLPEGGRAMLETKGLHVHFKQFSVWSNLQLIIPSCSNTVVLSYLVTWKSAFKGCYHKSFHNRK